MLQQEARASVALDRDSDVQTISLGETVPEEPVKEEVVIEPDLPESEPLTPAEDPKREYDRLLAAMAPDEPVYVAGNRAPRLKVGDYTLQPGEVVPGAHGWPRRESYERLGRIERR